MATVIVHLTVLLPGPGGSLRCLCPFMLQSGVDLLGTAAQLLERGEDELIALAACLWWVKQLCGWP
jgi:hypothetical protein